MSEVDSGEWYFGPSGVPEEVRATWDAWRKFAKATRPWEWQRREGEEYRLEKAFMADYWAYLERNKKPLPLPPVQTDVPWLEAVEKKALALHDQLYKEFEAAVLDLELALGSMVNTYCEIQLKLEKRFKAGEGLQEPSVIIKAIDTHAYRQEIAARIDAGLIKAANIFRKLDGAAERHQGVCDLINHEKKEQAKEKGVEE